MAEKSKINWTDASWNPLTGCTKISEGCKYCYAHDCAKALKQWGNKKYENEMEINLHNGKYISLPRFWNKPRMIFVDSMCDLFHKDVPFFFIDAVWKTMRDCTQHTFQILTKRAERMQEVILKLPEEYRILTNVWLGVTTENQKRYDQRVPILINTPAYIRWVSMEPLIGPIDMGKWIEYLDWIVVGGETEPNGDWRPMELEWVTHIRDTCIEQNIPFFFKHWNAKAARYAQHLLEGEAWELYPTV